MCHEAIVEADNVSTEFQAKYILSTQLWIVSFVAVRNTCSLFLLVLRDGR